MSLNRYGNSLTLPLLNSGHAGRYSCNASNAFTNSSSQIEVTVNCEFQRFCIRFISKLNIYQH